MPFKKRLIRIALLIIALWSFATTASAQVDSFIFRYRLELPITDRKSDIGIKIWYTDGTFDYERWPILDWWYPVVFEKEIRTAKEVNQVDVGGTFQSRDQGNGPGECQRTYMGSWMIYAPFGYEVTDFQMADISDQGSISCTWELPEVSPLKVEMSLLPVIHIVNPDPARIANPTDNIYCDNQPVHLKVDRFPFGDPGANLYWQYRLDPSDNFHPLDYGSEEDNWDRVNFQGSDVTFTLRDMFGENYTQYLNKRIEFRAVHAQKYDLGYYDGNGISRPVNRPNEGSNTFTYVFYPSTIQPVRVTAVNPACAEGKTNGADIQFERALLPGEVLGPVSIFTKDSVIVSAHGLGYDGPLVLDGSNILHVKDTLHPGDYYLTLEGMYGADRQCNKIHYNFTISSPTPVNLTVTDKKNASCLGEANGTITVQGAGGVGGYAYSIDNGVNWQSANTFTGLAKGSYTLTVRDANNCSGNAFQTVTISEPAAALTSGVTSYSDPTSTTRTDGSINIAANGGTPPYTYLWNNGATTQNISGLGGGTYTVTVTDANSCTATTDSLALVPPPPITIKFTTTSISCHGSSDGAIQATVSGGTKPYTYAWSNGNRTATASNLAAGHYSLLVTDANNVKLTQEYDLTEPVTLEIVPTVIPVSCNGKTDGAISTVVNGGTTPYTYRWSNGTTTPDLSQVPAGSYHLSVTDARNCRVAMDTLVPEPAALLINGTVTPPAVLATQMQRLM